MFKILLIVAGLLFFNVNIFAEEKGGIRFGKIASDGTLKVVHAQNGTFSSAVEESGFELSVVFNKSTDNIVKRGMYTLVNTSGKASHISSKATLLLGEVEVGYRLFRGLEAYLGANIGAGLENFNTTSANDTVIAYQVGALVGISGKLSKNVGYYVKNTKSYRFHNKNKYDEYISQNLNNTSIGVSLRF